MTQNSAGKSHPQLPRSSNGTPLRVLRSWPPFALKVRPFAWQEQKWWLPKMPAESHAAEIQGCSTTKKREYGWFCFWRSSCSFFMVFSIVFSIKHCHYIHCSSRSKTSHVREWVGVQLTPENYVTLKKTGCTINRWDFHHHPTFWNLPTTGPLHRYFTPAFANSRFAASIPPVFHGNTLERLIWNIIPWRFGSDHFPL